MEWVREWWHVMAAVVAAIVFVVRTEGKASTNAQEIVGLRKDLLALEARIAKQRAEDNASLQRDWVELKSDMREMRDDIKKLLQRHQ